ncbi:hypothetical protein J4471_04525 [Candidatus Woesearchaeota archaeon]|nr:hypothetical protein [Candidatus Woesearchaeota archaeon]
MVNFKPSWLKVILSISLALVIAYFTLQLVSSVGVCCLAYRGCPEGQVNIRVGPNHPGEFCCQICGTEEEKVYWEEYYKKRDNMILFTLKTSPFIAFLLIYVIFSLVQKPKKK